MNINKIEDLWRRMRVVVVCIAALLMICGTVKGMCFGMDLHIESRAPGSEADRLEKNVKDKENREASERVNKAEREGKETSPRDRESAWEYERDHGV